MWLMRGLLYDGEGGTVLLGSMVVSVQGNHDHIKFVM